MPDGNVLSERHVTFKELKICWQNVESSTKGNPLGAPPIREAFSFSL